MGLILLIVVIVLLFGGLGMFLAKAFFFGLLALLIVPFFIGHRPGRRHV